MNSPENSINGLPVRILLFLKSKSLNSKFKKFYKILYRFYTIFLGVDIPTRVILGKGLRISHPVGIVINENTVIGDNCWLRHCTTIGNKSKNDNRAPIIGNNVDIGSNSVIIGNIKIGDNCIIGAGSIVVKDVPCNSVVVGNPARIISKRPE